MKVETYESVNGVPFGAPESELVAILGKPLTIRTNRRKEKELYYEDEVYRFSEGNGFSECSGNWKSIQIGAKSILVSGLCGFLKENDPTAQECLGFMVSEQFGIAVDLEHEDRSITIFSRGRWDRLLKKA